MKNSIIVFTLFSFFTIKIVAQGDEPKPPNKSNHYLEIGFGNNFHGVRDESTSPLIYSGNLPTVHLEYFLKNNTFIGIIENDFSIGYLKTRNYPIYDSNKSLSVNNTLSIRPYFRVSQSINSKFAFFAGGEFGWFTNIRLNDKFNNASLNYEIGTFLAPSALLTYKTSWQAKKLRIGFFSFNRRNRDILFQYELGLPVVSNTLRPGYVTISDFVDNNSYTIDLKDFQFASLNKLFMVNSRFSLYYILHNNNMLKFDYKVGYYNYHTSANPVKGFHSTLLFSIVFRFSNN